MAGDLLSDDLLSGDRLSGDFVACAFLSAGAPDVALRPEDELEGEFESRRAGVGLPGPPRLPEPCDAPDSAMA